MEDNSTSEQLTVQQTTDIEHNKKWNDMEKKILDASVKLMQQGLPVTYQAIADMAQIAPSTVYLHYRELKQKTNEELVERYKVYLPLFMERLIRMHTVTDDATFLKAFESFKKTMGFADKQEVDSKVTGQQIMTLNFVDVERNKIEPAEIVSTETASPDEPEQNITEDKI